jgi:hypothetical protein
MAVVTKLEKITKDSMVPTISGGFVEQEYEGYAWRCEGCGLVWTRRSHAEQCESKGHVDHVVYGPYGVVAVENGKLVGEPKYYTHYAIRRDKVAKGKPAKKAKKAAAVKQEPKVNVKAEALERIAVLIGGPHGRAAHRGREVVRGGHHGARGRAGHDGRPLPAAGQAVARGGQVRMAQELTVSVEIMEAVQVLRDAADSMERKAIRVREGKVDPQEALSAVRMRLRQLGKMGEAK